LRFCKLKCGAGVIMYSLGILDGRIYLDKRWIKGNLYIRDGRVAAISETYLEAAEEYDAAGRFVLPGFIDPHVHFALNAGKYTSADDFRSGSISAAFGGITTFIDFLDPVKSVNELERAYEKRRLLSKDSVIDYGFHATLSQPEDAPKEIIKKIESIGIPSVKFFTAYASSNRNTPDEYLHAMMGMSAETSTLMLIHAENEGIIREDKNIRICEHEKARPAISEISEVIKLAEMTKYNNALVYIVHVSCGTTVKRLAEGYGDILNKNLFMESCPHYFTFTDAALAKENGCLYTMAPPLRSEQERDLLIQNIGSIATIGTDHCPFLKKEKEAEFTADIPMGIGGIEHSFSLLYSLFGESIIDKYTKNVAAIHGLFPRKGSLLPGSDADVAVFDPGEEWKVQGHNSNCDYDVYEGIQMKGKVNSTISRGRFVIKDGKFIGGRGEYQNRRHDREKRYE
jgi:dihydropyrimidinase